MTNGPPSGSGDLWHRGQVSGRRERIRRAPGRRPQGPRRWLAAAGYAGLAAVCLCLAAVAFLLVAPPLDAVRNRLIDEVDARSGRRLSISGPASLSLFPRPAVSFGGVAMLEPGGTKEAAIATVPSVEIEVSLWSLLLRQPQVGRLTLRRPTINLAVDAEGRRNWELAGAGRKRAPAAGDAGGGAAVPAERSPAKRRAAAGERLGGGSVRVIDATVRYRDERSGSRYEVSSLNLDLRADGWEGRADLDGTLAWRGMEVSFSGSAMPARALLAGQAAQLSLKISAAPVEAGYEGTLALKNGVTVDGKVTIEAASARVLGDWLGADWPARSESDAVALAARVTASGGLVTLSRLEAALGGATLAGSLAADIKGRPKVRGKLRVSELDFSRLLVRRGKRADVPAAAPLPAPAERGRRRNAWSDQTIDPRLLSLADADLLLSVGRLVYKGVKTGRGRLSVAVKDGLAKVAIEDVELYGGRGEGIVTLDGTGPVLAVGASLELAGVSVLPLLKDAGGVAWLDGRGTITLALSGRGVSERRIVEALDGKVDVAVTDGSMTGIDIGKIVRNVQRGRLASLAPAPKDRTAFSALTGTFDIAKGTARSRNLKLASAHLQLEGEGDIELGPRQIDYALRAKIAGGPSTKGATVRIGTLEIPISIKGPLEAPTFTIMGQEALTDAVRRIGKNLGKREVQDAIKGLLSGDREKKVDPRDLIEKLLR